MADFKTSMKELREGIAELLHEHCSWDHPGKSDGNCDCWVGPLQDAAKVVFDKIEQLKEVNREHVREWFDNHKDKIVRDIGDANGELEAENIRLRGLLKDIIVSEARGVDWADSIKEALIQPFDRKLLKNII